MARAATMVGSKKKFSNQEYIKTAKELGYDIIIQNRLAKAKDESECIRIMHEARKERK